MYSLETKCDVLQDIIQIKYRQVSNIRRTLVGNEIVDHSDVVVLKILRYVCFGVCGFYCLQFCTLLLCFKYSCGFLLWKLLWTLFITRQFPLLPQKIWSIRANYRKAAIESFIIGEALFVFSQEVDKPIASVSQHIQGNKLGLIVAKLHTSPIMTPLGRFYHKF